MSGKIHLNRIKQAQELGYHVTLLFFWLKSSNLAKERVKSRVKEGGHNIEPNVVERRYHNGIYNLFALYLPVVNKTMIYDNSENECELIAIKEGLESIVVHSADKFKLLKTSYDEKRK